MKSQPVYPAWLAIAYEDRTSIISLQGDIFIPVLSF